MVSGHLLRKVNFSTYILCTVVRQSATEGETSYSDVCKTASNNDLIGLSGNLVHISPASTWADNEVVSV